MSLGFQIKEVMSGYDEANKPFEFKITWYTDDIKDLLKRGPMRFNLDGIVLYSNTHYVCKGVLYIDYFRDHTITYRFDFTDKYGEPLKYVGRKVNIKPWNLLTSHTTCFGTVSKRGILQSHTVTYFKFRTILKFLSSFRFTRT